MREEHKLQVFKNKVLSDY